MSDLEKIINNVKMFLRGMKFEELFKYLLLIFIILVFLFILLILLDYRSNYNSDKLGKKIKIRTSASSIGGGQEAFIRYWVWQRQKRKICIELLCTKYPNAKALYPKAKWFKRGKVRFAFRRELWVIL